MKNFGSFIKSFEMYKEMKIAPHVPFVVRLDGKNFSSITKVCEFKKPFDDTLNNIFMDTIIKIFEEWNPLLVHHQSDEVSLLFPSKFDLFGRRIEKILSILPSMFTAYFNKLFNLHGYECDYPICFDARIVAASQIDHIQDYFSWRKDDSEKNCLYSYCFELLKSDGLSARAATKQLLYNNQTHLHDFLHDRDLNFNNFPQYHKTGMYYYKTPTVINSETNLVRNRVDTKPIKTREELFIFIKKLINESNNIYTVELPRKSTDPYTRDMLDKLRENRGEIPHEGIQES